MFPYVSIDIETSGIDPKTCEIIEFAAVLDDLSCAHPPSVDRLPSFHCYLAKDSYTGEPYALSMHSTIFRRIAERHLEENRNKYHFFSAERFGNSFKQFLLNNGYALEHDKVVITAAGKNFAAFDLQFLKYDSDFCKHIDVRSRVLDPGVLFLNSNDNQIPGMEECKRRAGMDGFVSHDALSDAKDVVCLCRKGINKIYGVS